MRTPLLEIEDLCHSIAARSSDTVVLEKLHEIRKRSGFILQTIKYAADILNEEAIKELEDDNSAGTTTE